MTPHELIVDSFAGGGGASLGIQWALGRSPDKAINHDAEAIALHKANHPETAHFCENVWKVNPAKVCGGRPVGLMWLSPDCKHFSKAKGGKPVDKKIRGLAWVATRWAKAVKPRVIVLENVEEFRWWGPLIQRKDGEWYPDPARRGYTFNRFVARLRRLGYVVEWRELRACDYGAPTIRKRLFLIARCDGERIVWPKPTHGRGTAQPWRTAAECIEWAIPCPSIFLTKAEARTIRCKRPLAEATLKRIATGLKRFVLDNPQPFIVPVTHQGDARVHGLDEPMRTVTGAHRGEHALVTPYLAGVGGRAGQSPERPVEKPYHTATAKADTVLVAPLLVVNTTGNPATSTEAPLKTITSGDHHALVAAFIAQHNGGFYEGAGRQAELPLSTITHRGTQQQVVASSLVKLKGTAKDGQPLDEPLHTVQAGGLHYAEVRAFMVAYYGNEQDGGSLFDPMRTVTAKDRLGLVTVHGELYEIADIGMRMLVPRELYRAQGFPDSYLIDIQVERKRRRKNGQVRIERKWLTKTAQVRMCGNSVPPHLAMAIVRANCGAEAAEVAA